MENNDNSHSSRLSFPLRPHTCMRAASLSVFCTYEHILFCPRALTLLPEMTRRKCFHLSLHSLTTTSTIIIQFNDTQWSSHHMQFSMSSFPPIISVARVSNTDLLHTSDLCITKKIVQRDSISNSKWTKQACINPNMTPPDRPNIRRHTRTHVEFVRLLLCWRRIRIVMQDGI